MCTEGPPATNLVYVYYLLISLAQPTLIKGLVTLASYKAYAQAMSGLAQLPRLFTVCHRDMSGKELEQ